MSTFKDLVEEHRAELAPKKQQLRHLEAKIVDEDFPALGAAVFAELNADPDAILANQRELDRRCQKVRDDWQKFNRELDRWPQLIADLDRAVADLGNIRTWSLGIQEEVQSLADLLATQASCQKHPLYV
jgi:hypothetical protein